MSPSTNLPTLLSLSPDTTWPRYPCYHEAMTDEAHKKYLADKHARMATPRGLLASYVQKAVGSQPEHIVRIIKGNDHEVYDVTTTHGTHVIVRIAREAEHRLEAEKWALDAARTQGVPTPQVYLLEPAEHDGASLMICIEEKIPGKSLDELIDAGEDVSTIIPQLGKVLGRIHGVKTEGFGYLQPNGKAWDIPWRKIMLDLLDKKEELLAMGHKESVPEDTIEAGLDILAKHTELYECDAPVLNHGDFIPAHILVEDNRITGVIDMQQCSGNHPIFDFATWEAETAEKYGIPAQLLFDTYPDRAVFHGKFDLLLNLTLLRHSLWMLMVESDNGNTTSVMAEKRNLAKAMKFFESDVA